MVCYGPIREEWRTDTVNLTHVGFAPYEDPEVAYAVMIPWASTNFNLYLPHNNEIAREILDYYFELKKKYEDTGLSSNTVEQQILRQLQMTKLMKKLKNKQ
ncbi:Cell elongation-specific peptidoglycan D,D-transpeptidase OS=Ureibacillus acetophenoni OX=614649 GN=SAMN05877842_102181 PE=3 SV=1 [Ureibacillus acetophenoni]